MQDFRIVLIVSTDKSDLFFANQLAAEFDVAGVLVENQSSESGKSLADKIVYFFPRPRELFRALVVRLANTWRQRFAVYNWPENQNNFGEQGRYLSVPKGCEVFRTLPNQSIHDPKVIAWLQSMRPNVIAVCGASLLGNEILAIPDRGVVNLHGGLSQHYRGLFTTDWAIFNGQPEYIGATVHFVGKGVDDGTILYQGRPMVSTADNPNRLYEKVVRLGVAMMCQAIRDIAGNNAHPSPLVQKGKLYLQSMVTPAFRRQTWKRCRNGVIVEYLANKNVRDKPVLKSLINEYVGKSAGELN